MIATKSRFRGITSTRVKISSESDFKEVVSNAERSYEVILIIGSRLALDIDLKIFYKQKGHIKDKNMMKKLVGGL